MKNDKDINTISCVFICYGIEKDKEISIKKMHDKDTVNQCTWHSFQQQYEKGRASCIHTFPFPQYQKWSLQKYNIIYQAFNGDRNSVPCLTNADIRRPMISNIRRCINNFSYILHNVNDYNICKNSFNHFGVNIPHINVYVNETGVNSKCIELRNTHIYNKIRML